MPSPNAQPQLLAMFGFDPVTLALTPGSFGLSSITPVIAARSFTIVLAPAYGGTFSAAEAAHLHIMPTVHEASTGLTITPATNGFTIDFGAALTREVTIKVERLTGR